MKTRALLLAVVAAVVLPTGCVSAKDRLEARYAEGLRPFSRAALEEAGLTLAWSRSLSVPEEKIKVRLNHVYLYDDLILVTDRDNVVYAFDRRTGEKAWITLLPLAFKFPPTLDDGVFYGQCGKRMISIDKNGNVTTGPEFSISLSSGFVVEGDYIFAPCSDGGLYKLDRQKLRPIWPAPARTSGAILGRPISFGSYVVIGTTNNEIIGIDKITSGRLINYKTRGPVTSGVTADVDAVFAGSSDFHVYCVTENNTLRWKRIVQAQVTRSPILAGDTLYVDTLGAGVFALDKRTGDVVWRNSSAEKILANDAGSVLVEGPRKELWVLDAADGEEKERLDLSEYDMFARSRFADGMAYLVSEDGDIACVKTK